MRVRKPYVKKKQLYWSFIEYIGRSRAIEEGREKRQTAKIIHLGSYTIRTLCIYHVYNVIILYIQLTIIIPIVSIKNGYWRTLWHFSSTRDISILPTYIINI